MVNLLLGARVLNPTLKLFFKLLLKFLSIESSLSLFRMWQYYYYYHAGPISPGGGVGGRCGGASRKDADSLSQREMIVSPSDHSSVAAAIAASASAKKKSKNRISRRDGLMDITMFYTINCTLL